MSICATDKEGARFCNACGSALGGPVPQVRETRKTVTVLFIDAARERLED